MISLIFFSLYLRLGLRSVVIEFASLRSKVRRMTSYDPYFTSGQLKLILEKCKIQLLLFALKGEFFIRLKF